VIHPLLRNLRGDRRSGGDRRFAGTRYPDAKQREEEFDVDRLRYIIGSARIEALLPVALHRLRSDGNERDIRKLRALPKATRALWTVARPQRA